MPILLAGCASASSAAEDAPGRASRHPDPSPITFAVVGDSITAWTSLEPGLSSWVGTARSARVLLKGGWAVAGATTVDMLAGVDDVPDADVLVVMAGTNDILGGATDASLAATADRITEIVRETGIDRVVLSAVAPNDFRQEGTEKLNDALAALAARHGWTWFDPWMFVREADGGYVRGVSADGIHPSRQVEMRVGTELRGVILDSGRD
ncbi:SGNH/GDSL hydrolase family protein [Salinibacterium soli]|uniref:SGNH/GDSL hydrolase family protein n=1 Tax=Antiquaquibacter soli TaxID=3064523 RepID=A0ABT9BKD7_9MICO|nr:SGNH/GDSL hydrolase family protein [Protaetiibacter sp. WY-16]MDO7881492.1 SGNH/GDSL hydrolase family protein [Protaetiibacter sp. WY-16]